MFDVLIIGGGTAAMSAAIYTARKKLSVEIIADKFGGQTALQPEVWNYPGFLDKDGLKLLKDMRKQVEDLGVEIQEVSEGVKKVSLRQEGDKEIFILEDKDGNIYEGRSVIVASGKKPKKLGVPGEEEFSNKGVTYCATCDAPLFGGKVTAVVGAGNSGLDSAMQLTKYAKKVYVLVRSDKVRGDQITQDKLKKIETVEFIMNAEIQEIKDNYAHKDSIDAVMKQILTVMDDMKKEQHRMAQRMDDFAKWVRDVIGDDYLAKDLEKATSLARAARYASSRTSILKKRLS